ncbi:hypothetical protein D3C80_1315610 [compost metagenome]
MQVLELVEQFGEGAEVASGTPFVRALDGLLAEETREQRELQQLVEQAREGIVGVLHEHGVAFGQRARPVQHRLVLRLTQLVDEGLEALMVVEVPNGQRDAFGPRPYLGELREQENQRSDHQADFLALEEHI